MSAGRNIILAAGGTGGHLFPAQALADQLLTRGHRLALVTDRRGVDLGGAFARVSHHVVRAGTFAGRGWPGKIRGLYEIVAGILQARALLPRLLPHAVVGFGGYPSLPTMLAAARLGIPAAIHEQNAVLGRVNRLLAARVSAIALSHAKTALLPVRAAALRRVTGNPVRGAFATARERAFVAPGDRQPLRVLVLGGSQGARVFSQVVPEAVRRLAMEAQRRLHIVQQSRAEDMEQARAVYRDTAATADLATFFPDVVEHMAAAHVVISRSGASTVAEIAVVGRPALFVPYPHATDDHQAANARSLADAGAAWILRQDAFTPEQLAERLTAILANPAMLVSMAAAARAAGIADAAHRLADLVEAIAAAPQEKAA
ncbi:MAG: undecaprenyldiphospho-muramoylpentapeptide beta-N-acetylglucosaminyltransferase [Alphaproteobacteria bacterium]|nr:undecaprenyldiphospho-muramoylpentapeptide beta-N-acetylglucosaminyltransferase [Alphaproteobacteria bacterium]